MRFKGKNVLVTGAAGNLGKAVAAGFEKEGAALVLFDIDDKTLRAAYPSSKHLLVPVNLLDPASVATAVATALQQVGGIDVLANIAGGFRMGDPVHATSVDTWRLMIELNAGTVMNMARAVVPGMLANGGGKIVSIAATAGLGGKPDMGAYAASKAAVIRLTESMAGELRDKGINVNCVMPSIIDTPQNRADMPSADPKKWVAPSALAEVIMFLASDAASAVHGAAVPVVGLS